uniref:Putative sodium bicarbonate cotransporter n=1 Tax=Ixodes ricinus TaxID=34613 RepID=A0A0K8R6I3_IXORI
MDQQITAVIINRKENKLKKGCGYHLDLLVLSVLIAICSRPRTPLVCGGHCARHDPRQLASHGVRVFGAPARSPSSSESESRG